MLHPDICVSIMTEFAENQEESGKQDCERKAFYRLIRRLREQFPRLPICICGDSLYAAGPFFTECRETGSIPSVYNEYQKLRKLEGNLQKERYPVPEKKIRKGSRSIF